MISAGNPKGSTRTCIMESPGDTGKLPHQAFRKCSSFGLKISLNNSLLFSRQLTIFSTLNQHHRRTTGEYQRVVDNFLLRMCCLSLHKWVVIADLSDDNSRAQSIRVVHFGFDLFHPNLDCIKIENHGPRNLWSRTFADDKLGCIAVSKKTFSCGSIFASVHSMISVSDDFLFHSAGEGDE